MLAIETLPPAFAARIFDRLGSTGQPPERGANLVNVGTDELLEVLVHEYLRPIKEGVGNSTFKLVQASFGGGKTQFLHCFRERAWEEGFATTLVGLSPKECPFDRSELIYQEVVRRIEYPAADPQHEPEQGLDVFLETVAEVRLEDAGEAPLRSWIDEELRRAAIESRGFRQAVCRWFEAHLDGELDRRELLTAYLMGQELSKEDLRSERLHEAFEPKSAARWLRSLAQLVHALGLPGLVFLFDEMDRNMSLPVKRRREVLDNLRGMIDHCGQSFLPGVVWCYAVPPEFMSSVVPEYPALAQRLRGALPFSARAHMQPIIDLDDLPLDPAALFRAIGGKLLELSSRAHSWQPSEAIQRQNIALLSERFEQQSLESGTRRRFVKSACGMIEEQRQGGERVLDDEGLAAWLGGGAGAAALDLDDEETF